jgi:phage protein D
MTNDPFAPRFDIRVSGITLAADVAHRTTSLTVETNLDLAGQCGFVLANPDNSLIDSALFDIGKDIEVHLGYGNDLKPAFLGEITSIAPSFPADGAPVVTIAGYDKSYKMRRNQPEPTTHSDVTDHMLAARIAAANGLVPIVDPTATVHHELPQAESDMALLKALAETHFMDVYVEWDRLHFQYPRPQFAAHVLEWGRNLSSFEPRISSAGLAGVEVIRDYNQELAQSIFGMALAMDFDRENIIERLGGSAMDLLTSLVRKGLLQDKVDNPLDVVELAKSLLANLLEGMYEGTGSCIGIPELAAGDYIEIRGVGKRFSGTYRARKVTHSIDGNGFRTGFEITQSSHTSLVGLLRKHIADLPSPNKAEKFFGVTVAEVAAADVLTGRVKVDYRSLSEEMSSGWAACARPMAGKNMGFYALPQPKEQVLVAFEKGDLKHPYVLGSLWNAKAMPPVMSQGPPGLSGALDTKNPPVIIKSHAGHAITFDNTDDEGKLVIETKHGSSIVLDATDGSITISARGDLKLVAQKKITLEAAAGATKITIDDQQVNIT